MLLMLLLVCLFVFVAAFVLAHAVVVKKVLPIKTKTAFVCKAFIFN